LEIGDRNVIRECCTINRGTIQDTGITRIGHDNWIMAYVHIAHDCSIGNHTVFANSATLAGHVTVEDFAILGGFTLVHQFCTIGERCFTAMNSVISKDVPPFMMVSGHMAQPHGLNTEGLKRAGFQANDINQLRRAYKLIYRSGNTLAQAITALQEMDSANSYTEQLAAFLSKSTRGIVR
jgi:UDP-N-acetylglucosamine acyltransferase